MYKPKLPKHLEDSITDSFHKLICELNTAENFLKTMNRFGILTNDEMRVIYHQHHTKIIEQMRLT